MNTCFLDSNVIIYYKDTTATQHQEAVDLLYRICDEEITPILSPLALDEILHTTLYFLRRKNQKTAYKELSRFIADILAIPKLILVNPPSDLNSTKNVLEYMERYDLQPRDAYHLLTMQANKIDNFATFDNDFKKVFAAKLLTKA